MQSEEPHVFRSFYLSEEQFLLVKDRQGRRIDYNDVAGEVGFIPGHIAFAFGSVDYKHYRENYHGHDIACFT